MVAASLVACTSDSDKNAPPNPPPEPNPGQVVIIAGDHRIHRDPRDGEYALRTSAYGHGGLAVADDGSVYFRVAFQPDGRVAHIERDGRLSLRKLGNVADQLSIRGDTLWLFSASSGMDLTQASLKTSMEKVSFAWKSVLGKEITVLNSFGRPISKEDRKELDKYWRGSKFGLRWDGAPIVVSRKGELFEALGNGRLRNWRPPGYISSLKRVAGKGELRPADVTEGARGELIILGLNGILRISKGERPADVRFPVGVKRLPPWTAIASLRDGSMLLLGGIEATQFKPRPALIHPNGALELLSWGGAKNCGDFDGTLAVIGSTLPGGVAVRPDGSLVVSDMNCGRVYAFRMPSRLSGKSSN